jgi:hypothetical protein
VAVGESASTPKTRRPLRRIGGSAVRLLAARGVIVQDFEELLG